MDQAPLVIDACPSLNKLGYLSTTCTAQGFPTYELTGKLLC